MVCEYAVDLHSNSFPFITPAYKSATEWTNDLIDTVVCKLIKPFETSQFCIRTLILWIMKY